MERLTLTIKDVLAMSYEDLRERLERDYRTPLPGRIETIDELKASYGCLVKLTEEQNAISALISDIRRCARLKRSKALDLPMTGDIPSKEDLLFAYKEIARNGISLISRGVTIWEDADRAEARLERTVIDRRGRA